MKDFKGYGRSRSSTDSNVLTRHFNDYVNCLHTWVGNCRENMEVYVAEFDEDMLAEIDNSLKTNKGGGGTACVCNARTQSREPKRTSKE